MPTVREATFAVGAGADSAGGWSALVALAGRLSCPVWQEPFGAGRPSSAVQQVRGQLT